MATYTAVQSGVLENNIFRGLQASSSTTFTSSDTINCGTLSIIANAPYSMAAVLVPASGTLYLCQNATFTNTVISGAGVIVHAPGFIATSATGSPTTGPNSGGSTPAVFVTAGN